MTLYLGNQVSIEEAIAFNDSVRIFRSSYKCTGCISTVCCERCGYANIDSICLCIGIS